MFTETADYQSFQCWAQQAVINISLWFVQSFLMVGMYPALLAMTQFWFFRHSVNFAIIEKVAMIHLITDFPDNKDIR